jgi:predicted nucleic acid-binding protein
MSRFVLVDTGPLYAAVDPDDAHHKRAGEELKRLARAKSAILITYPTLLESYSLVLYRMGNRTASKWLEEVLAGSTLINCPVEDYAAAITKVAALPDQSITLFDVVLAVVAQRMNAEIWTYDHHFDVMRCRVWRGERE